MWQMWRTLNNFFLTQKNSNSLRVLSWKPKAMFSRSKIIPTWQHTRSTVSNLLAVDYADCDKISGLFILCRSYASSSRTKSKTKKKKSSRTTSKIIPGEVTLNRETWIHEMKDTIVEYHDGLGNRELGLVQRPLGKRRWAIIDENGVEREVNIYQISFQWPAQKQKKTTIAPQELKNYRKYALELLQQQQVDAETVWRHFFEQNIERVTAYLAAMFIFKTGTKRDFICSITKQNNSNTYTRFSNNEKLYVHICLITLQFDATLFHRQTFCISTLCCSSFSISE
jgi:hypothetical protein